MNETIKNILLEYIDINKYKKFKNSVYKFLNYELSESELEKDDLVWEDKLKTLPYIMIDDFNITELDAEGIIFEYLLDIGDNPLEYITLDDLRSKYYGNDVVNLLENTGWLDKYIKDEHAFPQTFNDVEKKGDRVYLIVDRWDEFTMLFRSGNQSTVEAVLGEDWAELYGYFDVDWESDVVDNLNEKSITHIKDHIKEHNFIGQEMSEYSMDDGQFHTLTEDMVNDTETILRLIDEEDIFNDLRSELTSQYRWAFEQAGENELFDNLKDEIEGLLGSEGKWGDVKDKEGNIKGQVIRFDITDIFYKYMISSMEEMNEIPGEYYGDYISMLSGVLDYTEERLSTPDMGYFYPDSTKTEENFNYNIPGNI
tara:strand:- start:9460 stop:10563 length:1104 start_codon:yes stop_codon:yes gene_type:complete